MATAAITPTDDGDGLGRKLELAYFHPAEFFRTFLRFEYLYTWQMRLCDQIFDAIMSGATRLQIVGRTCHGAGKTAIAGGLGQCFLYTRQQAKVLTLAQSWQGIEESLWAEINDQWAKSLMREHNWGRCLSTKLFLGPNRFMVGASSDNPAKLEGKHGRAACRIVDEAKTVDDEVFESTQGLLDAAETWDIWISTPSIPSGKFYERDAKGTAVIRAVVTIEDLVQDYNEHRYPALEGKEAWREECKREWGESDPRYRSRCMAEYIDNVEGALFPSSWIDRAFAQNFGDSAGEVVVGMDVAGSLDGDETAVVALRRLADDRLQVLGLKSWSQQDTMISKGRAVAFAREHGGPLAVDSIGLGKGVLDSARQDGYEARDYRASEKARDDTRFVNRKAEDSWALRTKLENGLVDLSRVPAQSRQTLKTQMVGMRYEELASGKLKVVDPSDSPDLADALLIASAAKRVQVAWGHLRIDPNLRSRPMVR